MSSNIDYKWYLVSLKPLDTYFFGGENTFGEGDEEAISYFAVSNEYPQQTSLLGLVRYILLEQNGALPLYKNKAKGAKLIGSKGFQLGDGNIAATYGVIDQLGPLLFKNQTSFFRVANPYEHLSVSWVGGTAFSGGKINEEIPVLEGYDPKNDYNPYLINAEQEKVYYKDVFIAHEQVGIEKKGGDNSFFKQSSYALAKDFSFCFWLKLKDNTSDNDSINFKDTTVFFGGERKPFKVTIEQESTDMPKPVFETNSNGRKLTLLSDAYMDNTIFDLCDFALSYTQDFRTVSMGFDGIKFKKSSIKLNLLKRGSILFIKDGKVEEIKKLLTQNIQFNTIGFNQFIQEDI